MAADVFVTILHAGRPVLFGLCERAAKLQSSEVPQPPPQYPFQTLARIDSGDQEVDSILLLGLSMIYLHSCRDR